MKKLLIILLFFFSFVTVTYLTLYPNSYITKFIVKKNYDYFVFGENTNKLKNIYLDFLVQRYFKNHFYSNLNDINEIMLVTKKFLVGGYEPKELGFEIKQTFYGVSLGQNIILGFGACEGINGILGLRLSKNFKNIKLFSLYDDQIRQSPHTLLKYSKDREVFYIDIYPNRSYFFSFQENLNLSNEIFKDNYLSYNKELFKNGFSTKEFDLFSYLKSFLVKSGFIKNKNDKFFQKIVSKNSLQKKTINVAQKNDKKRLVSIFIDARFEHILGNENKAKKLYQEILNSNCDYNFCKITKIFKIREQFY